MACIFYLLIEFILEIKETIIKFILKNEILKKYYNYDSLKYSFCKIKKKKI